MHLESSLSFIVRVKSRTICGYLHIILHISLIFSYVNHFWFFKIVLKISGNVEENPRPKPSSSQSFSICHWKLNFIVAHNYINLSLLRAYVSTHKTHGYTLIRADYSSKYKQDGVCINYKHCLAFGLLDLYYLEEGLNFAISFGGKLCNFISFYRSPSQSHDISINLRVTLNLI